MADNGESAIVPILQDIRDETRKGFADVRKGFEFTHQRIDNLIEVSGERFRKVESTLKTMDARLETIEKLFAALVSVSTEVKDLRERLARVEERLEMT